MKQLITSSNEHYWRSDEKKRNRKIGQKTGLQKLELIIKERRLRWLGNILRMEDS